MMDIVERLREAGSGYHDLGDWSFELFTEAAEEIAKLRVAKREAEVAFSTADHNYIVACKALKDFRSYIMSHGGDATIVDGAHHNPIWARIAGLIEGAFGVDER